MSNAVSNGPCGITFLSENLFDEGISTLTLGTENAQFPLKNLKQETTSRRFRSQENNVTIVVDLQQTRTINAFAISGNQTGNLGITLCEIKTSLTTDFSSSTAISVPLSGLHGFGYVLFEEIDHRFVEITLTGNGSFVDFSNLFIGEYINLEMNSLSVGSFGYGHVDRSRTSQNKYGVKFIDKLNQQKELSGDIEFCTKEEQEILDDLYIYHGTFRPLWVIVDQFSDGMNQGQYKLTSYCYFGDSPDWSANGGRTYTSSLSFEEVI